MGDRPVDAVHSWKKSSLSISAGECVEMARLGDGVIGMRDSKNPDAAVLRFDAREIAAFIEGVKLGDFDEFSQ